MATLINTGLYLNEGNYRDAGISAAGLAPVFGTGIIASRLATKGAFEALELVAKTERAGKTGELHHIATDKSIKSGFTEAYEIIFNKAGMSLQDDVNKIFLEGHSGAHTKAYKQYVLDYLNQATEGLSGPAAKDALKSALNGLKEQLIENPNMPYKGGL